MKMSSNSVFISQGNKREKSPAVASYKSNRLIKNCDSDSVVNYFFSTVTPRTALATAREQH